jgi:diguanylate cyclase (GGDEF)-like protein
MAEAADPRARADRLEARNRRLEALYETARDLGSSLGLDDILDRMLGRALDALDSGGGEVLIHDADENLLWVRASRGTGIPPTEAPAIPLGEGVCGWVGKSRKPLSLADVNADPRFAERSHERDTAGPVLCVPLIVRDRLVGVLKVSGRRGSDEYSFEDLDFLVTLGGQVALSIENSHLFEEALSLTYLDSLTRLYNHASFRNMLEREVDRAERYERPLSLVLIDVDEFKPYNDRFGHAAGSRALCTIARLICAQSRGSDIVSRYDGDQFAAILPETDAKQARAFADKVRESVDAHYFQGDAGDVAEHLTVSVGVAAYPQDAEKPVALLDLAEGALYASKFTGKNRVSTAEDI